jgi:predicted nucleic acid-binding protein
MLIYADSSALVKLVVEERESDAARVYLGGDVTVVASRVGLIEAFRAVRRSDTVAPAPWDELVANVNVRELDRLIADRAASLEPAGLRTLDAIHLATALEIRGEIDAFVTYDTRLADAARTHRLPVVSPA